MKRTACRSLQSSTSLTSVLFSAAFDYPSFRLEMAAENEALDKLYKASTTLVGVAAKLSKEGVDEFAEV